MKIPNGVNEVSQAVANPVEVQVFFHTGIAVYHRERTSVRLCGYTWASHAQCVYGGGTSVPHHVTHSVAHPNVGARLSPSLDGL